MKDAKYIAMNADLREKCLKSLEENLKLMQDIIPAADRDVLEWRNDQILKVFDRIKDI